VHEILRREVEKRRFLITAAAAATAAGSGRDVAELVLTGVASVDLTQGAGAGGLAFDEDVELSLGVEGDEDRAADVVVFD